MELPVLPQKPSTVAVGDVLTHGDGRAPHEVSVRGAHAEAMGDHDAVAVTGQPAGDDDAVGGGVDGLAEVLGAKAIEVHGVLLGTHMRAVAVVVAAVPAIQTWSAGHGAVSGKRQSSPGARARPGVCGAAGAAEARVSTASATTRASSARPSLRSPRSSTHGTSAFRRLRRTICDRA